MSRFVETLKTFREETRWHDKCNSNHIALFDFLALSAEVFNSVTLSLTREVVMNGMRSRSKKTYYDTLHDLVAWGWISVIPSNNRRIATKFVVKFVDEQKTALATPEDIERGRKLALKKQEQSQRFTNPGEQPTKDVFVEYYVGLGVDEESAIDAYCEAAYNWWCDAKGNRIQNWRTYFRKELGLVEYE